MHGGCWELLEVIAAQALAATRIVTTNSQHLLGGSPQPYERWVLPWFVRSGARAWACTGKAEATWRGHAYTADQHTTSHKLLTLQKCLTHARHICAMPHQSLSVAWCVLHLTFATNTVWGHERKRGVRNV